MSSNIDFESDEHTLTCCIGDILSPRENIVKHALNNSDKSHKKSLRKVAKNNASWNSPNVKSYISLQPVMAMQRVSSITRFPQIEQAVLPKSNPLSTRFSGNNSFGANGITHYSLLAQTGEPQRKRIQSPEECFMQVRSIPLLEIPAGQKERLQPYGNIGMRKESNMNAVEMKRKEITSVNTIKYCDPYLAAVRNSTGKCENVELCDTTKKYEATIEPQYAYVFLCRTKKTLHKPSYAPDTLPKRLQLKYSVLSIFSNSEHEQNLEYSQVLVNYFNPPEGKKDEIEQYLARYRH